MKPGDIGYMIQSSWSNAAALAGNNPCAPESSTIYWNAAPVLTDSLTITNNATPLATRGVAIAVGASKSVEVDLFSNTTVTPVDRIGRRGSLGRRST